MIEKSVFILGAGFSYAAGVPTQATLLLEVLEHDNTFDPIFERNKEDIKNFIEDIFPNSKTVDIEDVFTILDRGVNEKERFLTYEWQRLYKLRNQLIHLVLFIIDESLSKVDFEQENAYNKFIEYLIELRESGDKDLAIISTNWDNLLEKYISTFATPESKIKTDYCIYTYKLDDDEHKPDITLKARNYNNIKILKLHGSINWLYCSNCKRMYIDDLSIGISNKECQHCEPVIIEDDERLYIEPIIITPTLLKEYHNLYIQGIWQNAFIELQEATKVYFIGYSLPKINFELKYLLKKAIKDLDITVVLAPNDKDNETHKNYLRLFGETNVTYCFDGFETWITQFITN